MRVEVDLEIFEQIRTIKSYIKSFKEIYKKEKGKLKHDYSKFRLLRFTIIYIFIDLVLGIGSGLLLFSNDKEVVVLATGLLVVAFFVPYLLFLSVFLVIFIIQQIYLILKTLINTFITAFKEKK